MNQQKLIEDNMNLVYFTIHKFYPKMIADEDIVQCGMLGLCNAAQTWDETRSNFTTFACRCIGYEINNELKRRKRHKNTLSLDYPVNTPDGDVDSFGSLIAGDKDVDLFDVQPFYDSLSAKDKEVFDVLRKGVTNRELAKELGVGVSTAHSYTRRLRTLWRNYYGD